MPKDLKQLIREQFQTRKSQVKRTAQGALSHDYLVPGGPYEEQWDWDGFFIGIALSQDNARDAIYLKNWCLNYLEHVGSDGFTPGLLTPRGIDKRLKHIKPFLAQGAYEASTILKDFTWLSRRWSVLKKSIQYREKHIDTRYGLASWYDSMESGADNNVALQGFPHHSVLAADLNTFLSLEYFAAARIARALHKNADEKIFLKKSHDVKQAILKYLWNEADGTFYNIDRRSGTQIRRLSYSSLIPLYGGIVPKAMAKKMIKKNILNPRKLWAKHGLRTLSKDDRGYNQKNIIKPFSNWQGPVWILVNYFGTKALAHYGYRKPANELALKTVKLILKDFARSGGMHENYNADTGKPLAAPNFLSWNLLAENML